MARPKSIFERQTTSTVPPPEFRQKVHLVEDNEVLIGIANKEYSLSEYDPNLWRDLGLANGIQNPFNFTDEAEFRGKQIILPAKPLPDFL
jgi:hypothetical protein